MKKTFIAFLMAMVGLLPIILMLFISFTGKFDLLDLGEFLCVALLCAVVINLIPKLFNKPDPEQEYLDEEEGKESEIPMWQYKMY